MIVPKTWGTYARFETTPRQERVDFTKSADEDRRFRFLSGVREVGPAQIEPLLAVDHEGSENFLAFDGDRLIGTAMLSADPDGTRGEVAISLDADYKNRGIGWTLLDHLATYARARGMKRIESVESRSNSQAIAVASDMGFSRESYPGDPSLVLVSKDLDPA